MHEFFARRAARELSHLPGVERIFVYGSVASGTPRADSDIALAVIVAFALACTAALRFAGGGIERVVRDSWAEYRVIAAESASLDVFFGVIPSGAAGSHGDGHKNAG